MRRLLGPGRSAVDIAAATPTARDRYLDLLRAVAIAAVVVGHWLMAVVWLDDGQLRVGAALDLEPATHWLTWVVQVMPVFFLVGGAVNARSWRDARASGGGWAGWVSRRAARLLRPTAVLVWFWMVLAPTVLAAGVERDLIRLGAASALVPLWFLAVYLLLIALVPALLAAHERLGVVLPVALLGVAAGIDAAEAAGVDHVDLVNYLVVWSVPTVLGFHWVDGGFSRMLLRIGLPTAALGALIAAVVWFGYPVSMVGLAGDDGPNTPSVALALLGCVQVGIAAALQEPAARLLQRPRAWATVVRLNMVAMTVYLWHLTVMVLVVAVLPATGTWWSVAPLSAAWWLSRPLWLLGLGLLLAPVVGVLAPLEHRTPCPTDERHAVPMAAAVVGAAGAIAQLTLGGVLGWTAVLAALGLTWAAVSAGAFATDREVA